MAVVAAVEAEAMRRQQQQVVAAAAAAVVAAVVVGAVGAGVGTDGVHHAL